MGTVIAGVHYGMGKHLANQTAYELVNLTKARRLEYACTLALIGSRLCMLLSSSSLNVSGMFWKIQTMSSLID